MGLSIQACDRKDRNAIAFWVCSEAVICSKTKVCQDILGVDKCAAGEVK